MIMNNNYNKRIIITYSKIYHKLDLKKVAKTKEKRLRINLNNNKKPINLIQKYKIK